ncbi:MAG: phenylalanine--tRNA ligase subunit beta [Desulfobacteraceae bacterium]|nr:phenylalanine--tRNA ligase subunit beta [Desulfobacteraceae bacterium]
MLISLKWLSDYVSCSLPVERIAEGLTMAGLEIEAVSRLHPQLKNVITARIESVEKHPRADRLSICIVSGGSASYRVVCGAPNVAAGAIVALALPGAELSGGLVKEAVLRGVPSQGMLCSERELGLGDDHSGIWLLGPQTPVGVGLDEALNIRDTLLEVAITPNRGDCLSVVGIAREVAALCKTSVKYPGTSVKESGPPIETLTSITVDDPAGCPRYSARLIQGVRIGPSPGWLKARVESAGVRSINNIVDVTNYVMLELGQPLHAFDFDRLREHRIVVRKSDAGERFTTLDGTERNLPDGTVLICDGVGPVAVGGIMGGLNSEITPDTANVLIESAYFDPISIRRSSRRLGLKTESAYRFERGIDHGGVIRALDRAAMLMNEVGGGSVASGLIDVYPERIVPPVLPLRVDRTNRFLGTDLSASAMREVLEGIEMKVEQAGGNLLQVTPPTFRGDITREVDLTEEVARLAGYDGIPVTSPRIAVETAVFDPHQRARHELKGLLAGAGFFEVINYSFIAQEALRKLRYAQDDPRLDPVRLKNPLSDEQAVMRTSLIPGLLQIARHNLDHRNEDFRIFELSKVFLKRSGELLADEPHHLAGVLAGKRTPQSLYGSGEDVDFADAKGIVEAVLRFFLIEGARFRADALPPWLDPYGSASLYVGDKHMGELGGIHPEVQESFDLKRPVFLFRLDFDGLFALRGGVPVYKSLPKFPPVARDMALAAEERLAVEEPLDFIHALNEPLLEGVEVFDIFRSEQLGAGKKSIGYRLTYRASDRSLTDEEVNEIHGKLVEKVMAKFGVSLR